MENYAWQDAVLATVKEQRCAQIIKDAHFGRLTAIISLMPRGMDQGLPQVRLF